jgi:hypothetical protein
MAAGLPVRPYAGPLGIPEGNEEFGVNQSLPEGVSSPSEAIHAASAHMHVKYPAGLGPARVGTALTIC